MFVLASAVTVVLAAAMIFAAVRKLSHDEAVVASYRRVGVPEEKLNYLAIVLIAGALGLLLGLVWAPLGIATAVGVVGYFTAAVFAHIVADDTANLPMPAALLVTAVIALGLRLITM
jgi:hypothetical protein